MLNVNECLELVAAAAEAEHNLCLDEKDVAVVRAFQHELVVAMGAHGLIAAEHAAVAAVALAEASVIPAEPHSVAGSVPPQPGMPTEAEGSAFLAAIVKACEGIHFAFAGPALIQQAALIAVRNGFSRANFVLEAGRIWDSLEERVNELYEKRIGAPPEAKA